MIVVTALGSLDVRDQAGVSRTTLLAQPKRSALLAYLAVEGNGGFVSRDSLLAMFWPDADESRARASLRQALAFLRRSIGEAAIRGRGDDEVGVDPAHVRCDVADFREALSAHRFEDALALYRGDFLAGLLVDEGAAFERWCAGQRLHLAREAAAAAGALADDAASREDWGRAIALARRACALSPLNEEPVRRLLTVLDRSGDRASAMQEFDRFAEQLDAALDVTPSPETAALVATMRERTTTRDAGREARPLVITSGREARQGRAAAASGAGPGGGDIIPAGGDVGAVPAAPIAGAPPSDLPGPVRGQTVGTSRWYAGAALVVAVALLLAVTLRSPRLRPSLAPAAAAAPVATRFVVLPLEDETGDPQRQASGRMAADWITEGISRIEGVEVVPATAVLASEQALVTSPARTSGERWQRLAAEVGAGVVVRGAIYRDRDTIHLQAQLVDAQSGRLVRPVERVSVRSDSLMAGIDQLRTRVVAAIAPLTDSVTHLRRAIAPPSYEAYRTYVAGLEAFVGGNVARALSLFQQSAAADSAYPMPRIAATIMHLNLNDAAAATRLITPLVAERDRLGPLERSTLDMVQGLLAGDMAATYDAAVRQARIAPGTIGEYMVAEMARKMNRPAEAVAVLHSLGPDRGELRGWRPYWREMTFALHLLGRHGEELEAARDARRRYPSDFDMAAYEVRARAALGDGAALDASLGAFEASAAVTASGAERGALRLLAATEWQAHDHPGAGAIVRAQLAWFDSLPAEARDSPVARRQRARLLLLASRPDSARSLLRPLLPPLVTGNPPSVSLAALAGILAAAAGDLVEARRWSDTVSARAAALSAAERGLSWGEAPYWRSAIAAQSGDTATAIALFRTARREGMGIEPSVHAEPAFSALRHWPPFSALLTPVSLANPVMPAPPSR